MKLTSILTIGAVLAGSPLAAQNLQFSSTYAVEQESRFDISTRILRDAFFTIDDDIVGIFNYPLEKPETTQLFLLGIGALVLADVPITRLYQDSIEPVFDAFFLPPLDVSDPLSFLFTESRYLIAGLTGS